MISCVQLCLTRVPSTDIIWLSKVRLFLSEQDVLASHDELKTLLAVIDVTWGFEIPIVETLPDVHFPAYRTSFPAFWGFDFLVSVHSPSAIRE